MTIDTTIDYRALADRPEPVLRLDPADLLLVPEPGTARDDALTAHVAAAGRYAAHQTLRAVELLRKLFGQEVSRALFDRDDEGDMRLIAVYSDGEQLCWYDRDSALRGSLPARDRDNVEAYGGPVLPYVDSQALYAIGMLVASANDADAEWGGVLEPLLLRRYTTPDGTTIGTEYYPGEVFHINVPGAVEEVHEVLRVDARSKPLTRRQVLECAERGWLTAVVRVDFHRMLAADFDDVNDLLSELVTGDESALTDIGAQAVGVADEGRTVLVEVTGNVTDWLAAEDAVGCSCGEADLGAPGHDGGPAGAAAG